MKIFGFDIQYTGRGTRNHNTSSVDRLNKKKPPRPGDGDYYGKLPGGGTKYKLTDKQAPPPPPAQPRPSLKSKEPPRSKEVNEPIVLGEYSLREKLDTLTEISNMIKNDCVFTEDKQDDIYYGKLANGGTRVKYTNKPLPKPCPQPNSNIDRLKGYIENDKETFYKEVILIPITDKCFLTSNGSSIDILPSNLSYDEYKLHSLYIEDIEYTNIDGGDISLHNLHHDILTDNKQFYIDDINGTLCGIVETDRYVKMSIVYGNIKRVRFSGFYKFK